MSYSSGKSAMEWELILTTKAQTLIGDINEAYDLYKKWYAFTYGKSDADIATALGITTQEVTDMQYAFGVFNDLNNAMNNAAVSTADRLTMLLKFGY
jgi:hypothetical protein